MLLSYILPMGKFMFYVLITGKKALENDEVIEDAMGGTMKCGVLISSAMGGMKVNFIYLHFVKLRDA
ncbi:hypothetical protein PTKIN_Ptkin14bG0043900 [Pterospermum kingtungense]